MYKELTDAEIKRNIRGDDRMYIGPCHSQYTFLRALYEGEESKEQEQAFAADGVRGTIILSDECVSEGG